MLTFAGIAFCLRYFLILSTRRIIKTNANKKPQGIRELMRS